MTAEAHHQQGVALWQAGDLANALAHLGEAIRLAPAVAAYRNTAGIVLASQGEARAATPWIRSALVLAPDDPAIWSNHGHVCQAAGASDAARRSYFRALASDPAAEMARAPLSNLLIAAGEGATNVRLHRRALVLTPASAPAWCGHGTALRRADARGAMTSLRRALRLAPGSVEILNDLGIVQFEQNLLGDAILTFDAALTIDAQHVSALNNCALALQRDGQDEAAYTRYARTLAIEPSLAAVHSNLAGLDQGAFDHASALRRARRAVAINPTAALHSSLICNLASAPDIGNEELFAECRRWETLHMRGRDLPPPHVAAVGEMSERPLRVGWCSADFSDHPVARNVIGLIENRDRSKFFTIVYADLRSRDATTARFRRTADSWREIAGMSDAAVAEMMRADRLDILIMVAGHTLHNRMGVATHAPAPVQISFHDFTSSGLRAMDGWLTDPILHPPTTSERFTETLIRLPCLYLQERPAEAPPVTPPPSLEAGRIVFGSMNNPRKYNTGVFAAWARILDAVPGSLLKLKYLNDYASIHRRERILGAFARHGIGRDRIAFINGLRTRDAHLGSLAEIDIALDPFPFNGSTTSFEALWMGVPLVALAGERFVARVAASFLTHVGLPELIAGDVDEYVAIAVALAKDRPRLAELRATLRARVSESRLLDAAGSARVLDAALLEFWRSRRPR